LLQTDHLETSLRTLDASLQALHRSSPQTIEYEIYRNAVIKGFELVLEVSGKLLRRALKSYEASPRAVDSLPYKAIFRQAARHGLMDVTTVERWFTYRDNRNNTAHDYGVAFATDTLQLLPGFITDVTSLLNTLKQLPPV
jgi:nucleotidyltransferase substrate binding protein (TIGR01987 family)